MEIVENSRCERVGDLDDQRLTLSPGKPARRLKILTGLGYVKPLERN
jgi:hypothetical protein